MRRKLAVVLLALSVLTVSANAAPRDDDQHGGLFSRIRHVVQRLVKAVTGDELGPPKP